VCAEFGVFGGVFFCLPGWEGSSRRFFLLIWNLGGALLGLWFGLALPLLVFWSFLALVVVCLGWSFGLSLLC
jgi:hypothetical protein